MTTETLMTDGQGTQTTDTQQVAGAPAQTPAGTTAQGQDAATATPTPTNDGQPADGGKTGDSDGKPQGAPEKYEFKPTDGQQFDDKVLGAFADAARGLNLTQEAAQSMLDKMAPAMQARQAEQMAAIRSEWAESAKSDKEYGGAKLAENIALAQKALDKFGTPELRSLLVESGLGNHPELIRAFVRAGKAISEDQFVGGRGAAQGAAQSPTGADARSLYPNSNLK